MLLVDLYGIFDVNMLFNCFVNMITLSNDSMREIDNSRFVSVIFENFLCNLVLYLRDLRQFYQMFFFSMLVGVSFSSIVFVLQLEVFEGFDFNCVDNSMINELGLLNDINLNSYSFV